MRHRPADVNDTLHPVRRPAVVAGMAAVVVLVVWLFVGELEPLLNLLLQLGGGDD